MDLLQLELNKLQIIARYLLFFSNYFLIVSCAIVQPESVETIEEVRNIEVKTEQKVEHLPLTPEIVYYVLTAELAGQRGDITFATDLYSKVAEIVESPSIARRSAQIANYTRNNAYINKAISRWLEVEPENPNLYLLQLPSLIKQNDFDGVNDAINKALSLAPDNTRLILRQIADNLSEHLTPDKAIAILQQIDLYQQGNLDAYFIYAQLAAFYQQYQVALPIVNQILEQQEDREEARILKAKILQQLGKGKEALALLKRDATKNSASHDLLFSYAKLLGENHQTEQAREIFEQLHTALPKNEEILFALGLLALEQKQGDVAKKFFSKLLAMGDPGKQASYFMGLAEELENNDSAALIWFASVPAESARFQSAQKHYINLLANNNQLDKARLHLQLLRKEQPNRALQYYVLEGAFLKERNKKQAAFDLYTQALTEYPDHIELLYGRAMVAESLNRLAVFEDDLRHILVQDPNNPSVLNALGYTLTDRTHRHKEALVMIQKAVNISPQDPFYLDSLGWVYYRLENLQKAIQYLKQAVEIQNHVEFLAHLGEVLWVANKQSEAKRVWMQGLKKDKNNKLLNETLRRFGQQ